MIESEKDRQLADEVARRKQATLQHSVRLRWALGASLLGGVGVGLAVWFLEPPADRDGIHIGFALGLATAVFFVGGLLGRLLLPKPETRCPRCGCDWNIESEQDVSRLLAWHRCPGCGLKMGEDI